MNQSLCREFIQHLDRDESLKSGNAPDAIKKWLESLGLPMGLLRFMQWDWPQADSYIGQVYMRSSTSLHAAEETGVLLKHKLMNAGTAPNGDWFVIDFSTEECVPGFITHEEWSPWSDVPQDPREYLEPIARSFESFLYRVVEERYLPIDYYAARNFNRFLANEENA
jgi:hypothetical protein